MIIRWVSIYLGIVNNKKINEITKEAIMISLIKKKLTFLTYIRN